MTSLCHPRAPLFSFAILGDSHVTPRDGESQSPWAANRLANARLGAVFAQIDALEPAFAVHLGDMVHPVPAQSTYPQAGARFFALAGRLRAPLHLVPGNHDVGDKPTSWMPAAPVDAAALAAYRQTFGQDHYAFEHGGCRFVVVNGMLINSGLPEEEAQWAFLDGALDADVRTFVFEHYPPFLLNPGEREHYDNLAEPGRTRFLTLLAGRRVEALFCGHVHNIFYNRFAGMDVHVLPATSALRPDYADLFPVPPDPAAEFGRDLKAKLGFYVIDVFADGHAAHFVRSHGATDADAAARSVRRPKVHPRAGIVAPLGVDMRHAFADPAVIPFTGVVDEFSRKRVRNDYLLSALCEIGLARLRIPLDDLADAPERLADFAALGYRFCVFSYGLPDTADVRRLAALASAIDQMEIIGREEDLAHLAPAAGRLARELGLPVFLSPLRLHVSATAKGGRLAHMVRHGLEPGEPVPDLSQTPGIAGMVHAVGADDAPFTAIGAIARAARAAGLSASIHVRLAGDNPAAMPRDDGETTARVLDAALAAFQWGAHVRVYLDTFDDHDRGYFPRLGLVDRTCDLRPAGACLKRLAEILADFDPARCEITADGAVRHLRQEGRHLVLLPEGGADGAMPPDLFAPGAELCVVRLDTGAAVEAGPDGACGALLVERTSPERRREGAL